MLTKVSNVNAILHRAGRCSNYVHTLPYAASIYDNVEKLERQLREQLCGEHYHPVSIRPLQQPLFTLVKSRKVTSRGTFSLYGRSLGTQKTKNLQHLYAVTTTSSKKYQHAQSTVSSALASYIVSIARLF